MAESEGDDALVDEAVRSLAELAERAERDKVAALLAGEADANSAYVEINAGAGGTESQDWAEMLQRMYTRWGERHGIKVELIDHHSGEQAGIKSATILVKGENAYGNLKTESGVHRLVRISPYDSERPAPHQLRRASGSIPRSMTTSTSRSTNPICGSTPIGRRARADSTSTPPTARSASPISRPGSSSPARTSGRSTRTAPRR